MSFKSVAYTTKRLMWNLVVATLTLVAIVGGYLFLAPEEGALFSADQLVALVSGDADAAESADPEPVVEAANAKPIPVMVSPIVIQDEISVFRRFPGQLEARQSSRLAFENGGYLEQVTVDEGDRVEKGERLAALDVDTLVAQRNALTANRDAISAQLTFANTTLERRERLRDTGAGSVDQSDQALASRDELVARIAEVDANLVQNGIRTEKAVLRAPFDGYIGARLLDDGHTVAPGEPIFTIFELSAPRFRVGLPTDLDPGSLAETEVEIDGKRYAAELEAIRPDIDPATRTRTVLFTVPGVGTSGFGQPGTLDTMIKQELSGAWVPLDAMRAGVGEAWTILVVDEEQLARAVVIEVLHIGNDSAFVMGAFDAGDQMIVAGAHKIAPGQLVSPG